MSEAEREKWDARYRERGPATAEPSAVVVGLDAALPRAGRALDVGGGAGRHAVWLARRGLDVTLVDVSREGVALAERAAAEAGVAIRTVVADLDEPDAFPAGPWALIVSFHYLNRSLFDAFARELAPGGLLVFVQPTVRNLERHDRPPRPFLLDEGELVRLAEAAGLAVESCEEGWSAEGRHEAVLLARKRSQG